MKMAISRRPLSTLVHWIKKNRPSGALSGWLIFFVVSYVIIVKLDAYGRDSTPNLQAIKHKATHEFVRKRTHQLPSRSEKDRRQTIGIPREVLEEFENDQPSAERNTGKMYGGTSAEDDNDEPAIDLTGLSDNELMLFHEMEGKQDEIDENWKNYLDKNKNVMSANIKYDKQMHFQGIRPNNGGASNARVILPKLPKNVHVFDALREGKQFKNALKENKCILLKTMHGDSPICIHDPEDDEVISSYLFEHGAWEPNFLYITGNILKLEPELLFLDLGCNIGVYTILAAKLGTPVVSVDPNRQNLRLLTKSLSLGNIRDKVTLIRNAISDKHENVSLVEIVGNVGGTFVETSDDSNSNNEVIETLTLDDLTELFKHKSVFIKMDIETYEWKALKGAKKFFDLVDVRYILMEWIAHRGVDTAEKIIQFLTKRDLYPHVNNHHNTKLETENSHSWPDNILWIKY